MNMIGLTLPDGTRTQLEASEITDVEPIAGGSLVHRAAGEPMKVMQDARTIQTRINVELNTAATDDEPATAPAAVDDETPTVAAIKPADAKESADDLIATPVTRMHKLKRLMQGRVSGMAITIAQTKTF